MWELFIDAIVFLSGVYLGAAIRWLFFLGKNLMRNSPMIVSIQAIL
jgi:hypothetical protein